MTISVAWFDIPVSDLARAMRFYAHVTDTKLERQPVGEGKEMAMLGTAGCLFHAPEDSPSHAGSRVYFDANPDLATWLIRVHKAGGKTLVPKSPTGNNGFFAYFEDSEGNRVGLHSDA